MNVEAEPDWVEPLRAAARGAGPVPAGGELVRGERPGLLGADNLSALSSCLLAAFVVAAAVFRSRLAPVPFDLIALLLRTAALAFFVRALIELVALARRLGGDRSAASHVLAWSSAGLYYRAGEGREQWAARADVLAVKLPELPPRRVRLPGRQTVLLVLRPNPEVARVSLPPYFMASAELLAARLERWLDRAGSAPGGRLEPPKPGPEQRYARIAAGKLEPGEVAVPEGFGFRLRAPYGALLGVVFAADAVHAAGPLRARLLPGALAASLLAVVFFAGWLVWMNRRRKTRLGIGLAMSREELLIRGRGGVVSVPWGQLTGSEVNVRLMWSPFVGSYPVRILELSTITGEQVVFDGAFLGVPCEVVAALCDAYRARLI